MYVNIEINILDYYRFECEKVHMLVFINYWIINTIKPVRQKKILVMKKITSHIREVYLEMCFWRLSILKS